jgi:hypothetical protein
MTLISVYTSEGCIGRCDSKCYEATERECTCVCHGANHGRGITKAMEQTRIMAERWVTTYAQQHHLRRYRVEIGYQVEQFRLFEGEGVTMGD